MAAPVKIRKTPRALKVLIGCALVVGVILFGSCVVAGSIGVYFMTTPKQVQLAELIGEESLGAIALHADLDDPGVRGALDLLFDALERQQNRLSAGAPAPFRTLQALGRGQNRKNLGWVFPIEGIIVFDEITSLDPLALAVTGAINLDHLPRAYARSLDWIAALDDGKKEAFVKHGEHTILAPPEGAAFSLAGGTLLMATALPQMIRSLDRLDTTAPRPEEPPALVRTLAGLRGPGDLEFVFRLDFPEAQDFALSSLPRGIPGEISKACTRLAGWIDLVDVDTLHLQAELRCLEELPGAETWLEPLVLRATKALEDKGFSVEIETRSLEGETRGLGLDLHLRGLKARLEKTLDPVPAKPAPQP